MIFEIIHKTTKNADDFQNNMKLKYGDVYRRASMIEVKLENWEESKLQQMIVNKCAKEILSREFIKLNKKNTDVYDYTPYDKFKNFVANLVANKIYEYMINNEEIKTRIDKDITNAEKTIVKQYMTRK